MTFGGEDVFWASQATLSILLVNCEVGVLTGQLISTTIYGVCTRLLLTLLLVVWFCMGNIQLQAFKWIKFDLLLMAFTLGCVTLQANNDCFTLGCVTLQANNDVSQSWLCHSSGQQ